MYLCVYVLGQLCLFLTNKRTFVDCRLRITRYISASVHNPSVECLTTLIIDLVVVIKRYFAKLVTSK